MLIYGLDINIKSREFKEKHTGWVELDSAGNLKQQDYNIHNLADHIKKGLEEGEQIALGFEAPMWYPIPKLSNSGQFVMKRRFPEETNSLIWYLNGSQPTVKSIVLGHILFNKLVSSYDKDISLTTSFDLWSERKAQIYLYEGFVAGKCKPIKDIDPTKKPDDYDNIINNSNLSNDEVVDAFITAYSFQQYVSYHQQGLVFPPSYPFNYNYHFRVIPIKSNYGLTNIYSYSLINQSNNPSSKQTKPTYFSDYISVWEQITREVNAPLDDPKLIFYGDQKACDIYGYRLRS